MTWSKPLYKKWTNPVYCRLWLQVKAPGEKTVTVVCWLWQCTSLWRTQSLDEYLRVFSPMKYDVSWTLISFTEKSEIWWYDWPIRAWSNGCVADVAWCHSNVDILEWIFFFLNLRLKCISNKTCSLLRLSSDSLWWLCSGLDGVKQLSRCVTRCSRMARHISLLICYCSMCGSWSCLGPVTDARSPYRIKVLKRITRFHHHGKRGNEPWLWHFCNNFNTMWHLFEENKPHVWLLASLKSNHCLWRIVWCCCFQLQSVDNSLTAPFVRYCSSLISHNPHATLWFQWR